MSGEEHKKGRASELEGQQQASGRAMFLLSGPQRGGGGGGVEVAMEQLLLSFLGPARGTTRAERFGRSAPGCSASFRKEVHSLEGQPLPPCCLCQEGKEGRGFVCMARREQEGGSEGAPVKTQVLGFHCLKWV